MKHLLITLLLLTSFFGFSQHKVNTSLPFNVENFNQLNKSPKLPNSLMIGEYGSSFYYFSPKKEGGTILKYNKTLELEKTIQVNLNLKNKKRWLRFCRLYNNEVHFFIESNIKNMKIKTLTVHKYTIRDLIFIEKKEIHIYNYPKSKQNTKIGEYNILQSPDKTQFKIAFYSNIYQGNLNLNQNTKIKIIEIDENYNCILEKNYTIDNGGSLLGKNELSNNGKLYFTYYDYQKLVRPITFLIDTKEDKAQSLSDLFSLYDILNEVQNTPSEFIHVTNINDNSIKLLGGVGREDGQITFFFINQNSVINQSYFNLLSFDSVNVKRCEAKNIHSLHSLQDGYLLISEYALLKHDENKKNSFYWR